MKKKVMCADCGCCFIIRKHEAEKLKLRGRKLPCHCPVCRNYRWMAARVQKRQIIKYQRTENKNDK